MEIGESWVKRRGARRVPGFLGFHVASDREARNAPLAKSRLDFARGISRRIGRIGVGTGGSLLESRFS